MAWIYYQSSAKLYHNETFVYKDPKFMVSRLQTQVMLHRVVSFYLGKFALKFGKVAIIFWK